MTRTGLVVEPLAGGVTLPTVSAMLPVAMTLPTRMGQVAEEEASPAQVAVTRGEPATEGPMKVSLAVACLPLGSGRG